MNRLSSIRLGILGAGQLAQMLCLKSHSFGIKPYILSSKEADSARKVTPYYMIGDLSSKKDLKDFLNKVDLAIFENEFTPASTLHQISIETQTPIHPKPKVIHVLQDRLQQKKILNTYKIPTPRFTHFKSKKQIKNMSALFPHGAVLKKRRQGYDGGGLCIVKNFSKDSSALNAFLSKELLIDMIAEEYIPFKRELALILVRNRKNQIVEFPLVETFQERGICLWVKGPCQHKSKTSLIKKLKTMIETIGYEGVIAFEIFETQTGKLLVNELAPRVHNSGHYSMNALSEDQFSLHIKAVLNLDISKPLKCPGGFAMLNLLGKKQKQKWLLPPPHTHLHWYGKTVREGRKLGHINNLSSSPNKALAPLLDFHKKYS